MNDQEDKQFHDRILEKIKSGKVTMHSKMYLVWQALLWVLALCLLAALGIFIVSFITFIVRVNGSWDLPQFGLHGLREFLSVFPWLFIPAILLFLWLMERFVLHNTFAYRIPVLYSAIIMIAIIIGGSLIVLATPLHRQLYESAQRERLPIAGGMYRFFGGSKPDDFYIGTVVSIHGNAYTLSTPREKIITIQANENTRLFTNSAITTGDCLEIIGDKQQDTVIARSIKKSDSSVVMFCHGPNQNFPPGMPPGSVRKP